MRYRLIGKEISLLRIAKALIENELTPQKMCN